MSSIKIDYSVGIFFSDFLLVGTKNWDLSKILFGQKIPKAAILLIYYTCTLYHFVIIYELLVYHSMGDQYFDMVQCSSTMG